QDRAVGGFGNKLAVRRLVEERNLLATSARFVDAVELARVGEARVDENAFAVGRPAGERGRAGVLILQKEGGEVGGDGRDVFGLDGGGFFEVGLGQRHAGNCESGKNYE